MKEDTHASSEGTNGRQEPQRSSTYGNIGTMISTIVSLTAVVSFIHDWGFFLALGVSFSQAPTTIADHLQSWLIWLPFVAAIAIGALARELFLTRVERGMTEQEIVSTSRNPRFMKRFRDGPHHFIVGMCVFFVVVWLLFGVVPLYVAFIASAVCWFQFVAWVFRLDAVNRRLSRITREFSQWVPTAVLIALYLGASSAGPAGAEPSMSHRLVIEDEANVAEAVEVELLRAFEEWLLVRNENGKLSWLRLNDVKRIDPLAVHDTFSGLACRISDRWCVLPAAAD